MLGLGFHFESKSDMKLFIINKSNPQYNSNTQTSNQDSLIIKTNWNNCISRSVILSIYNINAGTCNKNFDFSKL